MPLDPSSTNAFGTPWKFSTVHTPPKMHATTLVLTVKSVNETLVCDHSNESY